MKSIVVLLLTLFAIILILLGVISAGGFKVDNVLADLIAPVLVGTGVAILTTVTVWSMEGQLKSWLSAGPKVVFIDNDQRCKELKKAVLENDDRELFTTRFSTRPIGDKNKSQSYVAALKSRISGRTANTHRIVSIDFDADALDKKIDHVKDLLNEYHDDDRFGLWLREKKYAEESLFDLMISDGKFVCIGFEGARPDDNYWIRIDHDTIPAKFREFYETFYKANTQEIKACNARLSTSELQAKLAELEEIKHRLTSPT